MSRWPIERRRRPAWIGRLARHWQRPHTLFVEPGGVWSWPPRPQAVPARHADMPAWCRAHAGESARLVLSGRMSLQVLAHEPGIALADPVTIAAWARHQFSHYHGSEADRWPVATWSDGGMAGAAALRGLDLPALVGDAQAHGVSLSSAQPWWAVALRAVTRERPAFAQMAQVGLLLVEGAAATWLRCERGAVVDLQQRWLEAPGAEALEDLLQSLKAELPPEMPCWMLGYGCSEVTADAVAAHTRGVLLLSPLEAARPSREWVDA